MIRHLLLALLLAPLGASAADLAEPDDSAALLPQAPANPCVVNPALREPSIAQLELGDDATIRGDHLAARGHYRAALTVDACNAFAWASLGNSLLETREPDAAAVALGYATKLVPGHFLFWTELGRALEALGRFKEAREAYQEAFFLNPEHRAAESGMRRMLRASEPAAPAGQ